MYTRYAWTLGTVGRLGTPGTLRTLGTIGTLRTLYTLGTLGTLGIHCTLGNLNVCNNSFQVCQAYSIKESLTWDVIILLPFTIERGARQVRAQVLLLKPLCCQG